MVMVVAMIVIAIEIAFLYCHGCCSGSKIEREPQNRTQNQFCVPVLVLDLPRLISVSSLRCRCTMLHNAQCAMHMHNDHNNPQWTRELGQWQWQCAVARYGAPQRTAVHLGTTFGARCPGPGPEPGPQRSRTRMRTEDLDLRTKHQAPAPG